MVFLALSVSEYFKAARERDDLQSFHGFGTTTLGSTTMLLSYLFKGDDNVYFMDLGSGWGTIVHHASKLLGTVKFSIGVERNREMVDWSIEKTVPDPCRFICADIEEMETYLTCNEVRDYVPKITHIYAYDKVFEDKTLLAMAYILKKWKNWKKFASYKTKDEWLSYGLELELLDSVPMYTTGKQKFTCYIYEKL